VAGLREKFRIAAENSRKEEIVRSLLAKHQGESILLIGHYLDQLQKVAAEFNLPILTGKTPQGERERLFESFRGGETKVLAVSKVANFAVDLPDASVAIQISGTYGSRQEEAQRLGRILRPKDHPSLFYTLVSRSTQEEEYSANRQKFLTEQGYAYTLEVWE
jgi:DNA excision repair protein ERCC-3